jgi:hypothetical protein
VLLSEAVFQFEGLAAFARMIRKQPLHPEQVTLHQVKELLSKPQCQLRQQ